MKAILVSAPGGPEVLELGDVKDLEAGPGELLIDVHATALNRADLLQRRGVYPPPKGASEILGLECAGVVRALGSGVAGPVVGTRVMALLPGGGYAERAVVPEGIAIPIPDGMSFEEAAAIPEAFLTSAEALHGLARVEPGEWVLIHAAAGGVGSAAVQLAKSHGAKVIATAGTADKLAKVRELGADVAVDYKTEDFVAAVNTASGGQGANVVLDFVGGAYWDKHAECMAVGGRCVVIGLLGGVMANVNLAALLMKRHQILGLVMRSRPVSDKQRMSRAFARDLLPRFESGELRAVLDRVFPLAEARAAHERMERNENVGKIVLTLR